MNKIKKALEVLSGDCTNHIIKADMIGVLKREFMHLENGLDAASNHNNELINDYSELIMAVESKWPNETRHETALRYIKQAEESSDSCAKQETPTGE